LQHQQLKIYACKVWIFHMSGVDFLCCAKFMLPATVFAHGPTALADNRPTTMAASKHEAIELHTTAIIARFLVE
jgi:hypothetical protein